MFPQTKGILGLLADLITKEIDTLNQLEETTLNSDLSQGMAQLTTAVLSLGDSQTMSAVLCVCLSSVALLVECVCQILVQLV